MSATQFNPVEKGPLDIGSNKPKIYRCVYRGNNSASFVCFGYLYDWTEVIETSIPLKPVRFIRNGRIGYDPVGDEYPTLVDAKSFLSLDIEEYATELRKFLGIEE